MLIAAAAIIAFGASALTGLCLLAPERIGAAFSPAARARALLGLCILPALACVLVMSAALAPSFGWIADHCFGMGELPEHSHPHICDHHVAELPALSLLALASLLTARLAQRAVVLVVSLVRSLRACAQLDRLTTKLDSAEGELRILPFDAPQAFVLGWLRPTLYATAGLMAAEHREHLAAVLAHERAHVRRGDGLRSLIANAGLSFHLPFIARSLRERLARAQEMAADAEAADALGDRALVARALVHIARAQLHVPSGAFAFGADHIELRVRGLLDDRPLSNWPTSGALWLSFACAGALVALHAAAVHHAVEQALGFLTH